MSVLPFFQWLLYISLAHATRIGTSFTNYRAGICNTNLVPSYLCDFVGADAGVGASNILQKVRGFIVAIAAGIGVCMFIYACIQMVMSRGQEDKAASAKRMAIIVLVGIFLLLSGATLLSLFERIFRTAAPTCGNGVVEGSEQCDGGTCCAVACTFQNAGTQCRASAGACDPAENCSGTSADCPVDDLSVAMCRPAVQAPPGEDTCDVAEFCDGVNVNCPANAFKDATNMCRPAAPDPDPPRELTCDVAENCSGSSAACPEDGYAGPSHTPKICRLAVPDPDPPSELTCDVEERCDGHNRDCPPDGFKRSDEPCSSCVPQDMCPGNSPWCPVSC